MTTRIPTLFSTLVVAIALAAGLIATSAWADDLPGTTRFFETYDTNADGVVTAEEFDGSKDVFRLLDKDGDGAIQAKDLGLPSDYRPAKQRRQKNGAQDNARRGRPRDGANRGGRRLRQAIEKMDKDGDGKVTKAEWTGPEALFDRVDRNADGVIDEHDARRSPAMEGMDGDRPATGPGGTAVEQPDGSAPNPTPNKGPRRARPGRGALASLDADGDGLISREEWPGREAGFDRLDQNEDGFIALDELPSRSRGPNADPTGRRAGGRSRGMKKQMLERFDRDRNGRVSRDEFPGSDERFDAMDEDGDGELTEADIAAAKARVADKGPAAEGQRDVQPRKAQKRFERLDKDGDGKLNRAEFDGSDEDWQQLDRNKDGWLTADELA